jgi:hypothetical protein
VSLIGATGTGKTSFAERLLATMVEQLQKSGELNQSDMPFLYISAPATGDKGISWGAFYEDILVESKEILINNKQVVLIENGIMKAIPRRHKILFVLQKSVIDMIKYRNISVLVIDEAFHLLRQKNNAAVMDTIKTIADKSQAKIILLGTYDLFDLVSDYGQVARRSEILHFERYMRDDRGDLEEFRHIIIKLQSVWPCEQVPNFSAIASELMETSLGVIGLLKVIMLKSLASQLQNNGKWNAQFLTKAVKSEKLFNKIREEINVGESKIKSATYGESLFSGDVLKKITEKMNDCP